MPEYTDWGSLTAACLQCRACGLCETRRNVVVGVRPQTAEILFIGEGPGENEDKQGVMSILENGEKVIYYRIGTADGHVWQLEYHIGKDGACSAIRWFFEK